MKIYNATNGSMNLPLANGSRLIIDPKGVSKQFFPTVEMLNLLVSAYTRDDIAIIIDGASELAMGAVVSALPGYTVNSVEEALKKFEGSNPKKVAEKKEVNEKPMKEDKKITQVPAPIKGKESK